MEKSFRISTFNVYYNTPLEDYLSYKKEEREVAIRERAKKKHEEERRKNLRLTHECIKGTIVEIEPKALKIKTTIENFEISIWFPKFSIIAGYKEELNVLQEFMIKKKMLQYKREDALCNTVLDSFKTRMER